MFIVKIILGLVLFVALGTLGGNDLGRGVQDSKVTAAAQNIKETADDVLAALQIYQSRDDMNRSAYSVAAAAPGFAALTEQQKTAAVVGVLGNLLTPTFQNSMGTGLNLDVIVPATPATHGTDVYVTVSGISNAVCEELNRVLRNTGETPSYDSADAAFAHDGAASTSDIDVNGLVNGQTLLGACVTEATVGNGGTLIMYSSAQ